MHDYSDYYGDTVIKLYTFHATPFVYIFTAVLDSVNDLPVKIK